jgi:glutathione S-transferase
MKLFYSPGACSLADHIALIGSGLPFTLEKVDLQTKQTTSGIDYTQINPKGYVPALELDTGEVLTENIAILCYLSETSGKLMPPKEGLNHWRALETLAFISSELHKNFKPFFNPNASAEEKAAGGELLLKRFGVIEKQLEGHSFILGDTFTIADCYLFVTLFWAIGPKVGLSLPPSLLAYIDRLKQTPAVRTALEQEGLA